MSVFLSGLLGSFLACFLVLCESKCTRRHKDNTAETLGKTKQCGSENYKAKDLWVYLYKYAGTCRNLHVDVCVCVNLCVSSVESKKVYVNASYSAQSGVVAPLSYQSHPLRMFPLKDTCFFLAGSLGRIPQKRIQRDCGRKALRNAPAHDQVGVVGAHFMAIFGLFR